MIHHSPALAGRLLVAAAALVAAQESPRPIAQKLTDAEIARGLEAPPADDAARAAQLVELFRDAGAAESDVKLLPLESKHLAPRLEQACADLRARLAGKKAPPAEIEASVAHLKERHAKVGSNVLAVLPGRTNRIIGFAAHYDVAAGSPGAADDWAGCVLLASLFRALKSSDHAHTYWFLGFAGQELGCLGSAAWAASVDGALLNRIETIITVESAGLASPMAWYTGSSWGELEFVKDAAQRIGVPLRFVDFAGSASDSLSLKKAWIPVTCLVGIDPEHVALLHTADDAPERIDPAKLREMHQLMVELAVDFDRHQQPLSYPYCKAKLGLEQPGGRTPIAPEKIDFARARPPAPPPAPAGGAAASPDRPRQGSCP